MDHIGLFIGFAIVIILNGYRTARYALDTLKGQRACQDAGCHVWVRDDIDNELRCSRCGTEVAWRWP